MRLLTKIKGMTRLQYTVFMMMALVLVGFVLAQEADDSGESDLTKALISIKPELIAGVGISLIDLKSEFKILTTDQKRKFLKALNDKGIEKVLKEELGNREEVMKLMSDAYNEDGADKSSPKYAKLLKEFVGTDIEIDLSNGAVKYQKDGGTSSSVEGFIVTKGEVETLIPVSELKNARKLSFDGEGNPFIGLKEGGDTQVPAGATDIKIDKIDEGGKSLSFKDLKFGDFKTTPDKGDIVKISKDDKGMKFDFEKADSKVERLNEKGEVSATALGKYKDRELKDSEPRSITFSEDGGAFLTENVFIETETYVAGGKGKYGIGAEFDSEGYIEFKDNVVIASTKRLSNDEGIYFEVKGNAEWTSDDIEGDITSKNAVIFSKESYNVRKNSGASATPVKDDVATPRVDTAAAEAARLAAEKARLAAAGCPDGNCPTGAAGAGAGAAGTQTAQQQKQAGLEKMLQAMQGLAQGQQGGPTEGADGAAVPGGKGLGQFTGEDTNAVNAVCNVGEPGTDEGFEDSTNQDAVDLLCGNWFKDIEKEK